MSWVHPDPARLRKLLSDYQRETARQRRCGCPFLGLAAAFLIIAWATASKAPSDGPVAVHDALMLAAGAVGMFLFVGAVTATLWPTRRRVRILHEMLREDEVDLIPALVGIRSGPQPSQDRAELDEVLAILLNRVGREDSRHLGEEGVSAIRSALQDAPQWLRSKQPPPHQVELAVALAQVVVRLGDTSALRVVAGLGQVTGCSSGHARVRQAAAEAGAALRDMVNRAGDRLLRPAEASTDALLRPAKAVCEETLLRPAEAEQEQRQELGK